MKPYVHHHNFLWALDCSVGKNGMNSLTADVSYVQWYYTLAAVNPETPQDRKDIYKNVKITGACTGRDDDPLVQAITAHQKALSHPVIDGKISQLPGFSGDTKLDGHHAFFIIRLGARLARMFPDEWPRLDKIKGCPSEVAEASRNAVPKF